MPSLRKIILIVFTMLWCINATANHAIRFGSAVPAKPVESYENILPLKKGVPSRATADNAEVIMISGYEPEDQLRQYNIEAQVEIDRPNTKVVLILSSYSKTNWKVIVSPETNLSAVIVSSYEGAQVETTAKTTGYEIPYLSSAYKLESAEFEEFINKLNERTGINHLDTFRGNYKIPAVTKITTKDPVSEKLTLKGPSVQEPYQNIYFQLLKQDFTQSLWSLTGPTEASEIDIDVTQRAISTAAGEVYQLVSHGDKALQLFNKETKKFIPVALAPNFPTFSWPTGIAYDAKRNIISIVTLGGEGFLYRYDVANKKWVDYRSLNNIDIFSFTYDPIKDRYAALAQGNELIIISPEGDVITNFRIDTQRLPGFSRNNEPHSGFTNPLTLIAQDNNVAFLQTANGKIIHIWSFNLQSREGLLTFKNYLYK